MKRTQSKVLVLSLLGFISLASGINGWTEDDLDSVVFTGNIIEGSCSLNGLHYQHVALENVETSLLTSAGATAGDKNFNLSFNCPANIPVSVYFSGSNVKPNGNLENDSNNNAAQNIDIALYQQSGEKINLYEGSGSQNAPVVTTSSAGDATLNFIAKYYATGNVTPGSVHSSVDFNIIYP